MSEYLNTLLNHESFPDQRRKALRGLGLRLFFIGYTLAGLLVVFQLLRFFGLAQALGAAFGFVAFLGLCFLIASVDL